MNKIRAKILWVDDEINHLKPHILFLEEKGYSITTCSNGNDAITLVGNEEYNLLLLDQSMPGLDGLETLREIKEIRPALPIIMITKSEEEWLMDEAISEKVSQFLIKPVNPTQIFMACKLELEEDQILEDSVTRGYLKEFRDIEAQLQGYLDESDWWNLYNRLVHWQLDLDLHKNTGLNNILNDQRLTCNRKFAAFIEENYQSWLSNQTGPLLSPHIFKTHVAPLLVENKKVCFLIVDAMRLDQFQTLLPSISRSFKVKIYPSYSILPTATPFSRNAIFSGLFPAEFCKKYPQQKDLMETDSGSLNKFEEMFLMDQLKRFNFENKKVNYFKIFQPQDGQKIGSKIGDYLNQDLLAFVVNFVDQVAHKRSESDVLKEMLPDESGYRQIVKTWFEKSWLGPMLMDLKEAGFTVIMTSDHGSTLVNRGAMVGADKGASKGVRYKYGRNLNTSDKNAYKIHDPELFRLPSFGNQYNYIFAKNDFYFLYPNQQHFHASRLKNSFQHGGISMEEMLIPVVLMEP